MGVAVPSAVTVLTAENERVDKLETLAADVTVMLLVGSALSVDTPDTLPDRLGLGEPEELTERVIAGVRVTRLVTLDDESGDDDASDVWLDIDDTRALSLADTVKCAVIDESPEDVEPKLIDGVCVSSPEPEGRAVDETDAMLDRDI